MTLEKVSISSVGELKRYLASLSEALESLPIVLTLVQEDDVGTFRVSGVLKEAELSPPSYACARYVELFGE